VFYRTYARPTSATVYEVFNCPSWDLAAAVTVQSTWNNVTRHEKLILYPGVPKSSTSLANTIFTLIGTSTAELPIHGNYFVSNFDQIATTSVISPPGGPQPGSVGDLQCPTKNDAHSFNCVFSDNACVCTSTGTSANCNCNSKGGIEALFKSRSILPITMEGMSLRTENDNVVTKITNAASLQMQVTIRGLTLVRRHDNVRCDVSTSNLNGCYSCQEGATFTATCNSTIKSATALIQCSNRVFHLACTRSGTSTNVTQQFQTSVVNETCSVTCGQEQSTVHLRGFLKFKPHFETNVEAYNDVVHQKEAPESSNIFNVILSWIREVALVYTYVAIGCILVITLALYICYCYKRPVMYQSIYRRKFI
jgi:hypothetical protein